jgi:hypothetical protein
VQLPTQDHANGFIAPESIISRHNADGTVILMKLDDTNFFYKLDGLAAPIWKELAKAKSVQGLVAHFGQVYPAHQDVIASDVSDVIKAFIDFKLVAESQDAADVAFVTDAGAIPGGYRAGGVKEFDLEKVEAEVFSESIYLDVFAGSDLRLKKDIEPIRGALKKVLSLDGITYRWNPEHVPADEITNPDAVHAGLIAQSVAEQMPELARVDRESGYLAIEYRKLTAYLVEAIKDLNTLVVSQEDRIRRLEEEVLGHSRNA